MQIIKLDATESTNTYLKELSVVKELEDFTVVTTQNQTLGRGQFTTKWESDAGKNLAISILKTNINLPIDRLFIISIAVSLSILAALKELGIPNLRVKWPNDIMSGTYKIGGILIENMLSGSKIKRSIIGFGLNVNQEEFKSAPHAASLKIIVGKSFNLDAVFYALVENLNTQLNRPLELLEKDLLEDYHSHLFRIGEKCVFRISDDTFINGIILGVSASGKLKVQMEKGSIQEFGLKELQLQY